MKTRTPFLMSIALSAAMLLFALATSAHLPADAVLPIHWNAAGQPDGFALALWALLIPPAVFLALSALFAITPRLEPLQDKLDGSAPVLQASWVGMALLALIVQLMIGLPAYGIVLPINMLMLGLGLVLFIIGNALPKSRPGFFVGIRTPWAIADTDNWIATHRLGGKLFTLAGAVIIVASIVPLPPIALSIIVPTAAVIAGLVPFAYSWWLWSNTKRRPAKGE